MLENDDSYAAEAAAAESLAKIKAPGAFEALKQKLATHPYRTVVSGIYSAFKTLHDKNAIPLALEDSVYGKPDSTRAAAIDALGALGGDNKDVFNRLMEVVDDPNAFMRSRAIAALGNMKNAEALPKLEEIVARGRSGGRFGNAGVSDAAQTAIEAIRAASNAGVDAATLQSQIDELKRSNRRLEERVEELQKRGR
jgi:HEAT repeat protein